MKVEDKNLATDEVSTVQIVGLDGVAVGLEVIDVTGKSASANLTPAEARQLAARLFQAAMLADPSEANTVPRSNYNF